MKRRGDQRRPSSRRAGFAGVALAVVLGQAADLSTAAALAAPRKLEAAYVTSLSFSPLFRAIDKGYLKDENLDLDLQVVQSASDTVAFLGTGRIDVAFGNIGDTFFNALARGVDVKIVAAMSQYPRDPSVLSPAPVLVRKALFDGGEVKTVADLKGRKFAFNSGGGIIEYLAVHALAPAGLGLGDIDVVDLAFPQQPVALTNGAIAAAIMPEPLATRTVEQNIASVLVRNPAPGAVATVLLLGRNLLPDAERPTVTALLAALRRAANELQSPQAIMSAENLEIWSRHTEIPAAIIARTAPYVFPKNLAIDVKNVLDQQNYLVKTHEIRKELPADRIIDGRYAATMQ